MIRAATSAAMNSDVGLPSTVLSASGARVFWEKTPRDVIVWPPSFEAYERLNKGYVPFVFVGIRHPGTGVLSGIMLVNAELADEDLWKKIELSVVPGFALAHLGVAANVIKFRGCREVDVMALCVHGVQRGGGAVLNEACAAELLNISPAWKKYQQISCHVIQEVGIAIQMVIAKHMSFVGSSVSRAAFVEFFVANLSDGNAQDLIFVLQKPLGRPMASMKA